MKIAILGSGGREHALAVQISKSKSLIKFIVYPEMQDRPIGNNVNLELDNFDEIYRFIKNEKIDLVIVGPEKPLVDGIVDYLNENIKVFGPNQKVAQLEGSKILLRKFVKI